MEIDDSASGAVSVSANRAQRLRPDIRNQLDRSSHRFAGESVELHGRHVWRKVVYRPSSRIRLLHLRYSWNVTIIRDTLS